MEHYHAIHEYFPLIQNTVIMLAVLSIIGYIGAMAVSARKFTSWPVRRLLLWVLGVATAAGAFAGPIGNMSHENFIAHMAGHLLLGMLAPIFLACSKPMTLLLRALPTEYAKKVSRLLNTNYAKMITNPFVASVLNIGGLFLIYQTGLYVWMHVSILLFIIVHLHVFLAGYLFTISLIYVDVTSHRYAYWYRAIALVVALGFHKALSKLIYQSPPAMVPVDEGRSGAMLMYYGGDIVDLILIVILCFHWYKSITPEKAQSRKASMQK
ncbi:cytochrome c oxidase assembly protein [Lacicoccus qingdaonensis]|uniref:Putative membrane protein n=1 Tax=Lacicoccus qingdaonensis TaxID=576118 RepID=A0A1G9B0N4_9BACL|nr:cytochrome c oxidase assembly protein [Salinicoccus qingdaonensis]SDK33146.1 putative membrane protein [Salinicoccus qingdaonensis]